MTKAKKETTAPTGMGTLTITIPHAEGGSTLARLQWFLDQINNGDIIDDITVSGGTLHGIMLHNEEDGMIGEWRFTEIQYDLTDRNAPRITPKLLSMYNARLAYINHAQACQQCRLSNHNDNGTLLPDKCAVGMPLYEQWIAIKSAVEQVSTAHGSWLDHTKDCNRCRGATRMDGHVITHEMCSRGTPLYINWQSLKNA